MLRLMNGISSERAIDNANHAGSLLVYRVERPIHVNMADASHNQAPQPVSALMQASAVGISPPGFDSVRSFRLGLVSFVLSLAGTFLLSSEEWRPVATVLIASSGVLAALAWGRTAPHQDFLTRTASTSALPPHAFVRAQPLGVLSFVLSIVLVFGSIVLLPLQPGEMFGLGGWLWLSGMLMLVASTATLGKERIPIQETAAGAPIEGLNPPQTADTIPVRPSQRTRPNIAALNPTNVDEVRWTRTEVTIFVIICLAALFLRVWDLSAFPYNIYPDEIMTGEVAAQSFMGGRSTPIFSTVWGGIDLPALWFYLVSISMQLGNSTLAAIRLPAALFGAATVMPLYFLLRDHWGRYAAIAGSALLAISASNIHYSRLALNNIVPQFFWAVCFLFLLRGVRTHKPIYLTLAGLMGGVSEHFYYGTRLLPFILFSFFAYMIVLRRKTFARWLHSVGLVLLGYVAGMGPLLAYYLVHPALYFGRGADMLTWNRLPTSLGELEEMWNTLWPILSETLLGISTHSSQDIVYFAPLLMPVEAALLTLGLGVLIWNWRHPAAFLLLASGAGVLLVGGVLVLYGAPPFLAHLTPAYPSVYAAAGIALALLVTSFRRVYSQLRVPGAAISLGLSMLLLATFNTSFYFGGYYADPDSLKLDNYRAAQRNYEAQTVQSRYLASLGPNYQVFRSAGRLYDPITTRYLVKGQEGRTINNPDVDLPLPPAPGKSLAFLFFPGDEQLQNLVLARYSGGTLREVAGPRGTHYFSAYLISRP